MIKYTIAALFLTITTLGYNQSIDSLKGHFNGSFESYSQYYLKDENIGTTVPQDKIGSNNFFKLDYTQGKLMLGIQYESYAPSILGYYDLPLNSSKLVNKYIRYSDKNFNIQVGDFYEQFGSGMILRSFENRQIGINNALEGLNVHVNPTEFLKFKILSGRTRKMFTYANSIVRGADAELDVTKLFSKKQSNTTINFGASYVGRFQEYTGPIDDYPSTVNAYAARFSVASSSFNFDAEYVNKKSDPHTINGYIMDEGKALQINTSYTTKNFGANLIARSMYNMDFRAERESEFATQLAVNYLPALTKLQDNLTSNIYVYNAQSLGETGLQLDLFYNLKKGSKLGGKNGAKLAVNASYFGSLKDKGDILSVGNETYYRDVNFELKKKWSKKFDVTLGAQNIFYNYSKIQAAGHPDVLSTVVSLGGVYKFANHKSIKFKAEHMWADEDHKNWAALMSEVSLSSKYSFYASDLYNYGDTKIHYYNVGASVTNNATRFSLGFGKQRAGLFCVGGVCRFVPASYGFTATLTTSFGN